MRETQPHMKFTAFQSLLNCALQVCRMKTCDQQCIDSSKPDLLAELKTQTLNLPGCSGVEQIAWSYFKLGFF